MKVAIIGSSEPKQTLIEEIIKAVEEKTGETIEVVNIHSNEAVFLTQKVPIKQIEPLVLKSIEFNQVGAWYAINLGNTLLPSSR